MDAARQYEINKSLRDNWSDEQREAWNKKQRDYWASLDTDNKVAQLARHRVRDAQRIANYTEEESHKWREGHNEKIRDQYWEKVEASREE